MTVPLPDRLAAFDEALTLSRGRLSPQRLDVADEVRAKVGDRLAYGEAAVVVALAGGTGSGKSSLFNALAGRPLAKVGATRPFTREATAWAVGEPDELTGVLEWLDVDDRRFAQPGAGAPDGLVLLDLPDHDSIESGHHRVVDRLVERVDLLIWVVDPLKYAQRALHAGYLRRMVAHADVTVVALNRSDELTADGLRACLEDLARLLADEGLERATVLATSAANGRGIEDLRGLIEQEVDQRRAIGRRVAADIRTTARELLDELDDDLSPRAGASTAEEEGQLVEALASAAGVRSVAAESAVLYRGVGAERSRPVVSRAAWRVLGPLRRPLRLFRRALTERPPPASASTETEVGTGRRPPTSIAVRHALLELAPAPGTGAAPGRQLRGILEGAGERLSREVGRAVARTPLRPHGRLWWRLVAIWWSLIELAALAGVLWLAALGLLAYLQLPSPTPPRVAGELPWPTALMAVGALLWFVTSVLRRRALSVGARRHEVRIRRRLRAAVQAVADEEVLGPVRAEREVFETLQRRLEQAAAR
ncbi:MAG: GTPase [Egibacteraceae bacterium]